MSGSVKINSFAFMKKLIERMQDAFGSGDQDFVLIFAYNGVGKPRLSMVFRGECKRKNKGRPETLYLNAFTEDLFTWDNDLVNDTERYLKNNYGSGLFAGPKELKMDNHIGPLIERYTDFRFQIDTDHGW